MPRSPCNVDVDVQTGVCIKSEPMRTILQLCWTSHWLEREMVKEHVEVSSASPRSGDHENVTSAREGVGQMFTWDRRGFRNVSRFPCDTTVGDSGHQRSKVVCLDEGSCNASITQDASPSRTHERDR